MNIKKLSVGSPWRTVLLVIVVAAADVLLSLMNLGMGLDTGTVPGDPGAIEFIRYAGMPVLAPVGAVALIWRRRFPRTVTAAAAIVGALSFSGVAFIVALFLLAKRRLDWWVAALIVLVLVAEQFLGIEPLGWDGMALGLVVLAAIAAWAGYRGQRARLLESRVASLKERADRAESDRAAEAQRSKIDERHRIAREMHDTLAHRMSLVAVQAAALQVDATDAETASAAKVIRETAHAALGELREVLGVLRDDTGTALHGPSGVDQIQELVAQWREAGISVDYLPLQSPTPGIPDAVSRAAYRVVQEGLTNVARHAPDAAAVVSLELQNMMSAADQEPAAELTVSVRNGRQHGDGAGTESAVGAGVGLVGLIERIELLGGSVEHGPTETGFVLAARIPFTPVAISAVGGSDS